MPNYSDETKRIIKSWYFKATDLVNYQYDDFDRFISLWISFNGFFVSEYYEEAKRKTEEYNGRREPSEWIYIIILSEKDELLDIYINLIEKSPDFMENLIEFKNLLRNTNFPGTIADLRPNRLDENYAVPFEDIENYKQFIKIIYQIRCNLFHGNKNPADDGNVKIVKTIFKAFLEFITIVYTQKGYLNE